MPNTRKIAITRTVLLLTLVIAAGAMSFAVYQDRSNGSLMDPEGVVDEQTF